MEERDVIPAAQRIPWRLPAAAALLAVLVSTFPAAGQAPRDGGEEAPAPPSEIALEMFELQMRIREVPKSLMEKFSEAAVVVAGRVREGGEGFVIEVEKIFKGSGDLELMKNLREKGIRCPNRTDVRPGALVIVFPFEKKGAFQVHYHQWLEAFEGEQEYRERFEALDRLAGGSAVPDLLAKIRAETERELALEGGQGAEEELTPAEQAQVMQELARLMEKFRGEGPARMQSEIMKYLESRGPRFRAWFEKSMNRRPTEGVEPRFEIADAVKDLKRIGTFEAFAGLRETYVEIPRTVGNGAILKALREMNPGGLRQDRTQAMVRELEEMLRRSRGVLAPEKLKELEETVRSMKELLGKEKSPEPGGTLEAAQREPALRSLVKVNERLRAGIPLSKDMPDADLASAAGKLRLWLMRAAACDASAPVDHRAEALEALLDLDPSAIPLDDLLSIAGDQSLSYIVRQRAVRLLGAVKSGGAVAVLENLLETTDSASDGPAAAKPWSFSSVSGFALKIEALGALGSIGDPAGIPVLRKLLATPEDPEINLKPWVARALAALKDVESLPALEKLLEEDKSLGRLRSMVETAIEDLKALKEK